jgi:hypothetical protein
MVKISTLFYLVDDLNFPSGMILNPLNETKLPEEDFLQFLDFLEIDPGEAIVSKILARVQ